MGRPMAKAVIKVLIDVEGRRYRLRPGLVNQLVYADNDGYCILDRQFALNFIKFNIVLKDNILLKLQILFRVSANALNILPGE